MWRNICQFSKYLQLRTPLKKLRYQNCIKASMSTQKIDSLNRFKENSTISGFVVEEVADISEIQLKAIRLQHEKTGAEYLHLARNDSNNVFCIGFRTSPMNSTGVAHILEHNVLCGSNRFPCKDPFFKMLNRSLSTFMNAMTGSDYTIYPFSTQNSTDYKNLLSIYLDAVFHPNLSELDFLQEGWRLENSDLSNKNSPIIFKGVVFNEMKGVFGDSQMLLMQKLQNGLLPSHTYGHMSGGDPLCIPNLTWKELREFHASHYHPSNSRIYSYGDMPLEDHLGFINDEFLSKFERINSNTVVPLEPKWSTPRRDHIQCFPDSVSSECQSSIAMSFLLNDVKEDYENFVLAFICELLVSGPNAPFYKSLIENNLGANFSPVTGFGNDKRNTVFSLGLQGVDKNKFPEIEVAIENTFNTVVQEGFSESRIEALLHNIELSLKHQNTNFGLGLAMNLMPVWNHTSDIIKTLRINDKIQRLQRDIKENKFFLQDKIKQYFKDNSHKYILTMSPDDDYRNKLAEAEIRLLNEKVKSLSPADSKQIWEVGQALKAKQEKVEDVSCLPTLKVSDISRNMKNVDISQTYANDKTPVQVCVQPTNGLTYFNAMINVNDLPEKFLPLLPLFCHLMTSMGADNLNFRELSQKAELVSNGLTCTFDITPHPENSGYFEKGLRLSSYCLHKNFDEMLDLWAKIIHHLKLDDLSRFTSLVKMLASEKANSLIHNGHAYAITYASSTANYLSSLREVTSGLSQILYLKSICDNNTFMDVFEQLRELSGYIRENIDIRVALNASNEHSDNAFSKMENFLSRLECARHERSPFTSALPFKTSHQITHHMFPFPVNYIAKSFLSVPYCHQDSAPLRLLAKLMFQFLHREIREKGGAYGAGASGSPGEPFSFYSYRDPHSTKTLETFDNAIEWVLSGGFDSQDVEEAKLGVFQKVDAPVSPGSKGLRLFLSHVSDEMFQKHRLAILDAQSDDIIRVCNTYLRKSSTSDIGTCLIGPENSEIDKKLWHVIPHSV